MNKIEMTCPERGSFCQRACTNQCAYVLVPPIGCLHFVGFRNPQFHKDFRFQQAVKLFGLPDFIHRRWDERARAEIGPDDVAVFATGDEFDPPSIHSWDDSHEDIEMTGGRDLGGR